MIDIINSVQLLSLLYYDAAFAAFVLVTCFLLISGAVMCIKNGHNRNPTSFYHFTSKDNFKLICSEGMLKGGHHGVIFTTGNSKFHNRGLISPNVNGKAVIIFRKDALHSFRKITSNLLTFFTGYRLTADWNYEFITKRTGHLKLKKTRRRGQVLFVDDVTFSPAERTEYLYMVTSGFLYKGFKLTPTFIYCMSATFFANCYVESVWFRLHWIFIAIIFFSLVVTALLLAILLNFIFKTWILLF